VVKVIASPYRLTSSSRSKQVHTTTLSGSCKSHGRTNSTQRVARQCKETITESTRVTGRLAHQRISQHVSIASVMLSQGSSWSTTHHSDGQGLGTEHGTGYGGAHSGRGGTWHVVYQLGLGSWDVGSGGCAEGGSAKAGCTIAEGELVCGLQGERVVMSLATRMRRLSLGM
jgi:hypothetical protein